MAKLFVSLKILIAYFYSQTPKTLLFTVKISRFLAQNWNQCNFGWRLLKFGCHGKSFWSLKISDNICELTPYCSREKFLIILYKSEICTILAWFCLFGCHSNSLCSLKNSDDIFEFYNAETPIIYIEIGTVLRTELKSAHFWPFCLNLVAMATPFAPLKFLLAYLNSPTSKTLPYTQTLSPYLLLNWILRNFGLFLHNFGWHGDSLGSVENSGSIFEFNNPVFTCLKFLDFLQGIEICAIWLIFAQIWLPWQPPQLTWKFR